jgi:hypothetical protein
MLLAKEMLMKLRLSKSLIALVFETECGNLEVIFAQLRYYFPMGGNTYAGLSIFRRFHAERGFLTNHTNRSR